jgi:hypothetical protein
VFDFSETEKMEEKFSPIFYFLSIPNLHMGGVAFGDFPRVAILFHEGHPCLARGAKCTGTMLNFGFLSMITQVFGFDAEFAESLLLLVSHMLVFWC